jgi:hypothetical protein
MYTMIDTNDNKLWRESGEEKMREEREEVMTKRDAIGINMCLNVTTGCRENNFIVSSRHECLKIIVSLSVYSKLIFKIHIMYHIVDQNVRF